MNKLFTIFIFTSLASPGIASAQSLCAKIEIIVAAAVDDRCESISEAAVECFRLLDQKLAGAERSRKAGRLGRGALQGLSEEYLSGVHSIESYLLELKREDPPCLNQEGEVEVVLEEVQRGLRTVDDWSKKKK